jgi:hypothetical protein
MNIKKKVSFFVGETYMSDSPFMASPGGHITREILSRNAARPFTGFAR